MVPRLLESASGEHAGPVIASPLFPSTTRGLLSHVARQHRRLSSLIDENEVVGGVPADTRVLASREDCLAQAGRP